MKPSKITDQELIELIKEDHDNLGHVYKRNKENCIAFMRKKFSSQNIDDLNVVFQTAIIILYEKIVAGNFELTSAIQTYLNSVCYRQLQKKFRSDKKIVNQGNEDFLDNASNTMQYDPSIEDDLESIESQDEIQQNALDRALKDLKDAGGKCYELLTLFWYHNKSMKELSNIFGYPNDANTKVRKYKCQKRLQKLAYNYLKA